MKSKPRSKAELDALIEKIKSLVASDPEKAARILASWIRTPAVPTKKSA